MPRSIRLLLIGDVHFPESEGRPEVDHRDAGVSERLSRIAAQSPFTRCLRAIIQFLKNQSPIEAILICGDLTSHGKLEPYKKCAERLVRALKEAGFLNKVHVTFGNHDIDRDSARSSPGSQFEQLADFWRSLGTDVLPYPHHKSIRATAEGGQTAVVYTVNSCLGCGEMRGLPKNIEKDIKAIFSKFEATATPEDAFSLLQEQLDTPLFDDADLSDMCEKVSGMAANELPVVLAHHNLLPQAITRIDIYTEVLNGGMVRGRLSSLGRPVVYVHGHIHSDPVEVVVNPAEQGGECVFISAPLFTKGFTVLDVHCSRAGSPIGLSVTRHELLEHGAVVPRPPIRIPISKRTGLRDSDPNYETVAAHLQERSTIKNIRLSMNERYPLMSEKDLSEIVCEGFWACRLDIMNLDQAPEKWHVSIKP